MTFHQLFWMTIFDPYSLRGTHFNVKNFFPEIAFDDILCKLRCICFVLQQCFLDNGMYSEQVNAILLIAIFAKGFHNHKATTRLGNIYRKIKMSRDICLNHSFDLIFDRHHGSIVTEPYAFIWQAMTGNNGDQDLWHCMASRGLSGLILWNIFQNCLHQSSYVSTDLRHHCGCRCLALYMHQAIGNHLNCTHNAT